MKAAREFIPTVDTFIAGKDMKAGEALEFLQHINNAVEARIDNIRRSQQKKTAPDCDTNGHYDHTPPEAYDHLCHPLADQ